MAFSGQARTHALQRVQTSRSIGFSWRHSTSNAPSQPWSRVTRPDHTGYLRSSGSSPPAPVMSTLTPSCGARRSAQSSAASAGPMMRSSPADLNSTAGVGSGSGSAAIARSAAILGVASADRSPHPPCSRTLTNLRFARVCACSASSLKSAASCVQATITSGSPSAAWKAAASRRQSWSCTMTASLDFNAAASALASMPIVRLQLQTLSVLPSKLILLCFSLDRFVFLLRLFFRLGEEHGARLIQRRQEFRRDWLADRPVARIRLERIDDIEMRVAEQLL